MDGGDFYANLDGLEHYKRFGYKGLLASKEEMSVDIYNEGNWQRVRYRYNRGIIHTGTFPHFSSPVNSLPSLNIDTLKQDESNDTVASSSATYKRVILGFNFFPEQVGECCER